MRFWGRRTYLSNRAAVQLLVINVPIDENNRRIRPAKSHQALAVFHHHCFRILEIQNLVCPRPVTDKKREPGFASSFLPTLFWPMRFWCPRGTRNKESCVVLTKLTCSGWSVRISTNEDADG